MIIFLDIDGVLNYAKMDFDREDIKAQGLYYLDQTCLERLEMLVLATDATVVISSTWRILNTREYMVERLGPIIGARLHENWATKQLGSIRGLEIRQWIEDNIPDPYKFKDYIILDDDKDFLWSQPLIWVDAHYGLQDEHVWKGIRASHGRQLAKLPISMSEDDITNFIDIMDDGLTQGAGPLMMRDAVQNAFECFVTKYR